MEEKLFKIEETDEIHCGLNNQVVDRKLTPDENVVEANPSSADKNVSISENFRRTATKTLATTTGALSTKEETVVKIEHCFDVSNPSASADVSKKLKTHTEDKAYKCDNFVVLEDELEEEEESNVTISTNSNESVLENTNTATFNAENLSEQDKKQKRDDLDVTEGRPKNIPRSKTPYRCEKFPLIIRIGSTYKNKTPQM